MKRGSADGDKIAEWRRIPFKLRKSIRGLSTDQLDVRGGSDGWSIRETVHHIVEANLIASNMMIAALAADGTDYDWTWVNPDKAWMRRVGYDKADLDPAIKALHAVALHITGLIRNDGRMRRAVRLNDAPGDERYTLTIEQILVQEIEHAEDHLRNIRSIRDH